MRHYVTRQALRERAGRSVETFCEDFVKGDTTTNIIDVECPRCLARMIAQMVTPSQLVGLRASGPLHESPEGS